MNNLFPSFQDSSDFNVQKQKCQVKYIAMDQPVGNRKCPTFSLNMTKLLRVHLVWSWEHDSVGLCELALNGTANIKAPINSEWWCL